jgi:hypothetical protein
MTAQVAHGVYHLATETGTPGPRRGRLGRVQLWNSAICTFLARIDPLGRLAAARYDVVILDRVWAPKTLSPLCDLGLFMD